MVILLYVQWRKRRFRCGLAGLFLGIFCFFSCVLPSHGAETGLSVSAKSAALFNASDGSLLWEKNAQQTLPMASTTKIMTALLTLEQAAIEDRVVEITEEMVRVEGSSMGLRAGDRLRLSALAAGMLSTSGNDAANAAAYALDGSLPAFAQRMNARAEELGLSHTHFVTPSGLDDDAHYTTAEDLGKLACAAMQNPSFAAIVSQQSVQVTFEQPAQTRTYKNHNKLLSQYAGCIGVKTGYTEKAGRCLVSCAQRDGVRLVAVTLHAPDDWADHAAMLDYGFSLLRSVSLNDSAFACTLPVVGADRETVSITGSEGGSVVIPVDAVLQREVLLPRFLYAPLEEGQVVGCVLYRVGNTVVGQTALTASAVSSAEAPAQTFWNRISAFFAHSG